MQLTKEQEDRVLKEVAEGLIEKVWAKIDQSIEEISCVSVARAAGILDLSTQQARRVFDEVVEFGPRDNRITLAALRRAIEKRITKKGRNR